MVLVGAAATNGDAQRSAPASTSAIGNVRDNRDILATAANMQHKATITSQKAEGDLPQKAGEPLHGEIGERTLARTSKPSEKCAHLTTNAASHAASPQIAGRVGNQMAANYRDEGNVEPLELKDLGRFMECPKCV